MFTNIKNGDYMNTQKNDILKTIFLNSFTNQRILAEESGHSLGGCKSFDKRTYARRIYR